MASGSAKANPRLADVAERRVDAEKRALIAARTRARAALERISVTSEETGRVRLEALEVEARVMGVVESCASRDTRYYSDGGVDVVIACPFAGGLALALSPIGPRTEPPSGRPGPTGLIVDASGVDVKPTLLPTLRHRSGEGLIEPEMFRTEVLRKLGGVVYVTSLGEARAHARAGEAPVVVDVTRVERNGSWQVGSSDSARVEGLDLGCVAEGHVVVVVAPSDDG